MFCNRCSGHNVPLPQFGMDRPVRVCNRCYVLHQFPEALMSPVGPNSGNARFFSSGDSHGNRAGRNSSGGEGSNNPGNQHRNRRSRRSAPPSTSRLETPHALTRCITVYIFSYDSFMIYSNTVLQKKIDHIIVKKP